MSAKDAATNLLYSGEQTDALTGQQYLRARYYNPNTGQFNRLDDFFGNHEDPQSFNKYAYVHGDPVQFVDPLGLFAGAIGVGGLGGLSLGTGFQLNLRQQDIKRVATGAAIALGGIAAAQLIGSITAFVFEAIASGVTAVSDLAWQYLTLAMANVQSIAQAVARQLARTLRARLIPVFPVFRILWPSIYAWRTGPAGIALPRVLNYLGPSSVPAIATLVATNRGLAFSNFTAAGGLPVPGLDFDEFPYASTAQGGIGAFGAYVNRSQNRSEGAMLGAFYRIALRNIPGSVFIVVDIP